MARHRVGSSYLSDQELKAHEDSQWLTWLFIIGALFGGALFHSFTKSFGLPKWLVFGGVVLSGIASGVLLAKLRIYIRLAVAFSIIAAVALIIGWVVWKVI